MKRSIILSALICVFCGTLVTGQTPKEKGLQAITLDAIKGQLEFLASDWMEGRGTGDRGSYLAADYVASMLKVFSVQPAGDQGFSGARMSRGAAGFARPSMTRSYFQNFNLLESQPGTSSTLSVKKAGREYFFQEGIDFSAGRAAVGVKFEAPVVFVGYGIADKALGIDDFAGVDVKGKVVLRLSGFPGANDITSPMYKKIVGDNPRGAFELSRKKNETLENLGAAGVIEISTASGDMTRNWGTYKFNYNMAYGESRSPSNFTPMRLDSKQVASAPVTVSVTGKVLDLILRDSGIDIARYEKEAAAGNVKFKPSVIPAVSAGFNIAVSTKRVNVRNVIAMIEGENPNEIVAIGAHMDHMGMENGRIWNGADDNASGTVGIVMVAKAFAASGVKPKRTVLFCAWTGEEKGLLGSEYFTLYPTIGKISDYKCYINFDMIARDAANDTLGNKKDILYTKAYPVLEEITKRNLREYGINLNLTFRTAETPAGGSDFTAFAANKIPVISWVSTLHPDYHYPSDHVNLVNWNKMYETIRLGYLQLWDLANGEMK